MAATVGRRRKRGRKRRRRNSLFPLYLGVWTRLVNGGREYRLLPPCMLVCTHAEARNGEMVIENFNEDKFSYMRPLSPFVEQAISLAHKLYRTVHM